MALGLSIPKRTKKKRGVGFWLRLLIFGLLAGYGLLTIGYAYLTARAYTRPARHELCCSTPADLGLEYEPVTFEGNQVQLSGWYIPSQNRAAVILLHGYGSDRTQMLAHAGFLAQAGYGVLLYDQRASGESQGDQLTWGWRDVSDVHGALTFLHTRPDLDPARIAVMGFSTGAEIAIEAAAREPSLAAVVADAPYYTTASDLPPPQDLKEWLSLPFYPLFLKMIEWRTGAHPVLSLEQAVSQVAPRPLLLITTGQGFEQVLGEQYYRLAGEPKSLWNIPEAAHGGGLAARPDEYAAQVTEFLEEALGK